MKSLGTAMTGALLAAIWLAGCGSPTAPPSGRTPASAQSGEATNAAEDAVRVVELSEAALQQVSVRTETMEARRIPRVLRAAGRVTMNENRTWRVGAATDGRVVEVTRNVGDAVKEGEALARMFSHDIHEARAEYARARTELTRLQSRRAYLQTLRDRVSRLHGLKAASLQQLQEAESELRNAEGEIGNAETELERTRFHLEEYLRVELEPKGARRISGYAEGDLIPILAPASGTIVERTVTPGTVVQPATDLFVISDMSKVWLIAAVQQQDLALVRMGMPVSVNVPAYPESLFKGRVAWIGSELDAATRTVSVRVELPNEGFRLRPEMYATAEIALEDSGSGYFVKQEALQEINGQAVVFVEIGEGRFAARPVETGPEVDGLRQIQAGIREGDRVVFDGTFLLKSKLLESSLAD